jgi:hypothetical protein
MQYLDRFVDGSEKFWQVVLGAVAIYLERTQVLGEHETVLAVALVVALQAYITRNGSAYTVREVAELAEGIRRDADNAVLGRR